MSTCMIGLTCNNMSLTLGSCLAHTWLGLPPGRLEHKKIVLLVALNKLYIVAKFSFMTHQMVTLIEFLVTLRT